VSEDLHEVIDSNPEWYKDLLYRDVKIFIRDNINSASRSFVAIGYYLKYIMDNQLYKEDGYTGVSDFAKAEFGISAAQASKFISINDRFSKDGNSPVLLEQYKDFSSSKLSEMLYLTDEQLEQVTITTTVAEIREIKDPENEVSFSTSKTEQKPKQYKPCKFGGGKCNLWLDPNQCSSTKRCASNFIADAHELAQLEPEYIGPVIETEENVIKEPKCVNDVDSIDDLDFTVRTYNCLKRAGIDTVDQLCELTEDDVIKIRNISQKCLDEIKLKLSEICKELKPNIPETVNDELENVDNEPEIVIDAEEPCGECKWGDVSPDRVHGGGELPCFKCCLASESKTDKFEPYYDPDQVETVEADIIQTVQEEPFTDQCETSGLKFNNWLKANGSSIADIVSIVLYDKKIPNVDNLHVQIQNSLISRLISKTEAYYSYLTRELGIEPEQPKQIQPELPILKNNDQRKEWAENYKAWGEWYYDEHIDCHYYKYDFPNGDRLVVEEYLNRSAYWGHDAVRCHYHLLQKHKPAYEKNKTFEQKYVHSESSMTEIIEYLKEFQKKGA
jgi:hypothetical protein